MLAKSLKIFQESFTTPPNPVVFISVSPLLKVVLLPPRLLPKLDIVKAKDTKLTAETSFLESKISALRTRMESGDYLIAYERELEDLLDLISNSGIAF